MKSASRRIIHMGVGYVISPPVAITNQTFLQLQQAVLSQGLEFQRTNKLEDRIVLERVTPASLQITLAVTNTQLGHLVITAPEMKAALSLFVQEAEAVISAFETVWTGQPRQIHRAEATMRELYESESPHAFQEIWEGRLGQSTQSLAVFGRTIRGGGLRFVFDGLPGDENPSQIETRIESFLQDTNKIFVESQANWIKPQIAFDTREKIEQLNLFVQNHVQQFMAGGQPSATAE